MSKNNNLQLTSKILMVSPDYFGYNYETSLDNHFQQLKDTPEDEIRSKAMDEFNNMVKILKDNDLEVFILKSPLGENGEITPDAGFPNNWFSTHPDCVVIYPMKAKNRRAERQVENLKKLLGSNGTFYKKIIDLTGDENANQFLEGTGSLVLDRQNKIAFALSSQRTINSEFTKWCTTMGYSPVFFNGEDLRGRAIYHTNVMMSVGEGFVVICLEAVKSDEEKNHLRKIFKETSKQVIEINLEQTYQMCGNILHVINIKGEKLVVMSSRASKSFNDSQLSLLRTFGKLIVVDIDEIETVGGGSARCMMAEIF